MTPPLLWTGLEFTFVLSAATLSIRMAWHFLGARWWYEGEVIRDKWMKTNAKACATMKAGRGILPATRRHYHRGSFFMWSVLSPPPNGWKWRKKMGHIFDSKYQMRNEISVKQKREQSVSPLEIEKHSVSSEGGNKQLGNSAGVIQQR